MAAAPNPTTQNSPAADPAPRPDADAILGLTSYNRADFELPVVSLHPSQHDAVRQSLFQPFRRAANYDLGLLGRLPFEIVSLICLELDVSTAFRLSHVNRTTREVLNSIREYRHLSAHALECLCVLLRTGLGARIDVLELYSALTTQNCSLCSSFGGFFFLPTATRCCLTCIASAPEMQIAHLSRVADAAGASTDELEQRLPVLHTLPDSRKRIVAVQHGLEVLREKRGDEDAEVVVS